jgi:hypothetical protein
MHDMRTRSALIAAGLLAIALSAPALAISTLDDNERNAPRIFRVPSADPPNAARRQFMQPRSAEPDSGDPSTADEGPRPDAGVATPSGTTFARARSSRRTGS